MKLTHVLALVSCLSLPAFSGAPEKPAKPLPMLPTSSSAALEVIEKMANFYIDSERTSAVAVVNTFGADAAAKIPANAPKGYTKNDAGMVGKQLAKMIEDSKAKSTARLAKLKAMATPSQKDFMDTWVFIYGEMSLASKNVRNQSAQFMAQVTATPKK